MYCSFLTDITVGPQVKISFAKAKIDLSNRIVVVFGFFAMVFNTETQTFRHMAVSSVNQANCYSTQMTNLLNILGRQRFYFFFHFI